MAEDQDVLFGEEDDSRDEQSENSSGDSYGSQNDFDFNGAPVFSNNDIGATAYPEKDKNGNWYLRVNLPLVGSVNLFVNNGSHDGLESSWNKLVEHYNSK